MTNGLERLIHQ